MAPTRARVVVLVALATVSVIALALVTPTHSSTRLLSQRFVVQEAVSGTCVHVTFPPDVNPAVERAYAEGINAASGSTVLSLADTAEGLVITFRDFKSADLFRFYAGFHRSGQPFFPDNPLRPIPKAIVLTSGPCAGTKQLAPG